MTSRKGHQNGSAAHSFVQQVWDDCLPIPTLSPLTARAALFIISVVCFIVSYDGDFVFDDSEAVVRNKDLLPETPLSEILQHDFWGNRLTNKSHKSYRPLTVLTYRWNYQMAGGLHPLSFHIVNIVLHGLVSVLFLPAFQCLLGGALFHGGGDNEGKGTSKAAFVSALLFATHPVHTESVAGVVGRADLLCAVFFLLSFLAYVMACTDVTSGIIYRPEKFSWLWMLVSAGFCFVATFSKEQGITVIGICCVYDIIIVCRLDPLQTLGWKSPPCPQSSPQHNGHHTMGRAAWVRSFFRRQFLLVVTAAGILLVRLQVMDLSPPIFQVADNPHSFVNGSLYRGLNYNYLYAINGWLLLNPWWLCFDWSMGCVPTITSLTDLRLVSVLVLWAVIGCLGCHAVKGELVHEKRCIVLALSFLVIPFLPASNLLFRVGFVIAERNLYLPSAGFCLLVTLGMLHLSSYKRCKQWIALGFYLLCIIFMLRCVQRSSHWRNELTLYSEGENVCPLNGKVHYNIAKLQADRGNGDYAIEKYRLAIQLNPEYDQAMNNLANMLKDRGEVLEAEALLTKAVNINPEFAAAWMNLGIVQAQLKKFEAAEESYHTAIRHRRKYPDCYYNLGNLYLDQKRHQDALTAWYNATQLKPEHLNSWSNAIILLDNLGHHDKALKMGELALKYLPDVASLWFNIANVYGKMEKWTESEKFFLKAISLSSQEARFHQNLGVLYHRWGKYDQAEQSYKTALKLDPNSPSTLDNLRLLEKARNKST